jgi:uncharacterized protein YcbX
MAITVTALSVTPVKGTRIHAVDSIEIDAEGARGDRAFYVVNEAGAMINAKRAAILQTVTADYSPDEERLSFVMPDGAQVADRVRLGCEAETTFFGTPRPARVLDGPWSDALSELAGEPLRVVRGGSAVDRGAAGAVSLVSRGSLQRLADADCGEPIDPRRFRMLIEIDGVGAHEEDRWVGRELTVGGARVRVRGHVGRCATTTRGPETAKVDYPTLKLLAEYRLDEPTTEPLAFGIHGEVLAGGVVRVGDPVSVAEFAH